MSSRELQNELDWSALCYAAGELNPAEAEAFEQLLAEDQAAREALARAVELTQAVAAAESITPVTILRTENSKIGRSRWGRRLAWMAVGSAASLLVAVLVGAALQSGGELWRRAAAAPAAGELAAAWSETRQEFPIASDASPWYSEHWASMEHWESMAAEPDESNSEESNSEDSNSDEALVAAAPSWMTAAVRSSAGLSVDMDTVDMNTGDGDLTPFDGEAQEN